MPFPRLLRRALAPVLLLSGLPLSAAPAPAAAAAALCPTPPAGGVAVTDPQGGYHAVKPVRVLDTRRAGGPVGAACVVAVDLRAVVPAGASAVALNATTVNATARGFVTAYACGTTPAGTSNLNPHVSDAAPNLVVVRLTAARRVCFYSFAPTDLVVDVTGWFAPAGDLYHEQAPVRALDTRTVGTRRPPAGGTVVTIALRGRYVPVAARAVAVNITVAEATGPGFATAYPCGVRPLASTTNYLTGENRANQALMGLSANGSLCVYLMTSAHLVVDVTGWFGPGDSGIPLVPTAGTRLYDTRTTGGRLGRGQTLVLDPGRTGGLPAGAHTVVLNVVATDATGPGYLTIYPCGGPRPLTSSVNYAPGVDSTNLVTMAIGSDGRVCIFAYAATHVVVDLFGAFGAPGLLRTFTVGGLPLNPPFSPDGHDYTLACRSVSNPVTFAATAMPGAVVSAGGGPATRINGSRTLAENAALVLRVTAAGRTEEYWVRCLPRNFPAVTTVRTGTPGPGWYLLEDGVAGPPNRFVMIMDARGVPVWYRRVAPGVIDMKLMPDGNLAWMPVVRVNFNRDANQTYEVHRLGGALVRRIRAQGQVTDFHDMVPLANGHFIVLSYVLRPDVDTRRFGTPCDPSKPANHQTVVDAVIQEVDATGAMVWSWRSRDHVDLAETVAKVCDGPAITGASATNALDLLHVDSLHVDAATDDLFVSARYLNAVLRIRRTTAGPVVWKLGGTAANHDNAVHFGFAGDPAGGWHLGHDARILPNGHITLYDNETYGPVPSRAVEYAIDTTARVLRLVWQRSVPNGSRSFGLGSVRRQSDGHTVVAWGGNVQPVFSEVDATGRLLLEVSWPIGTLTYRVVKVAPTAFDLATLRALAGR
jgi:hypothetical protein